VLSAYAAETRKALRFAKSFLCKDLVHTNLQVLYTCNFRCRICDFWRPHYRDRPRMSAGQATVIADKLAMIGPQIVSIGGGEPLVHPEIVEIARALSTSHIPVLITNGWYVTPQIARALFEAGLYEVSVSVDYSDGATHDAQRGRAGAHQRALAALETLHASRTRPYQRVHMISVVMEDNLDQIEPLIRWCEAAGITYLVTLYSNGRGQKRAASPEGDPSRRLLELKARHPSFVSLRGYLSRFTRAVRDGGIGSCRAGRNLLNVDSQGDVSLCIDCVDQPVGNLLQDSPWVIRRRLRQRRARTQCKGCWTSCRGSIETLMCGPDRLANLLDYYAMARSVPLRTPPTEPGRDAPPPTGAPRLEAPTGPAVPS